MKIALFAAALMLGGTAVAQTGTTTTDNAEMTTMTSSGTPERDARGIPVMSDTAMAPSGANQSVTVPAGAQVVPAPNQAAVFASKPSTKEYPACSRGQTDGCVQTYERGRQPN